VKCIKEKCKYYTEDIWKTSYFRCELDDRGRKKDGEYNCIIDTFIEDSEAILEGLRDDRLDILRVNAVNLNGI